nr:hypothetical protein [Tanacetum cinerariifolium]
MYNLTDIKDIESEASYDSNLDEMALLVTPLFDSNEDEWFDPGGDIDEIDDFLDIDISTDIKDGYHDSKGDIIYLESLLINDTIPNLHPKVFLDHDPRSFKNEPDNDDLMNMVKFFDLEIHEKIIDLTYVRLPFKDHRYFSLTFVIRIFLPYLTYSMDSPLLLSSGSEDTIFDLGIFAFHFSSLEPVASHQNGTFMCFNVYPNILNEIPMEICSSTCLNPNITMIWELEGVRVDWFDKMCLCLPIVESDVIQTMAVFDLDFIGSDDYRFDFGDVVHVVGY